MVIAFLEMVILFMVMFCAACFAVSIHQLNSKSSIFKYITVITPIFFFIWFVYIISMQFMRARTRSRIIVLAFSATSGILSLGMFAILVAAAAVKGFDAPFIKGLLAFFGIYSALCSGSLILLFRKDVLQWFHLAERIRTERSYK